MERHREARIDPDYDPSDADLEHVAKILARAAVQPLHYQESNGNSFSKWALGIIAGLIVLGIPSLVGAMVYLSSRVAVLETKVDMVLRQTK